MRGKKEKPRCRDTNLLVIFSLPSLENRGQNQVDNALDVLVERDGLGRISKARRRYNVHTHNLGSGLPFGSLGKLVHGLDVLEQGTDSRLPDTLVVVIEQVDENLDGLLNIGHESRLGSSKELSDGIGGDLLFDGDGAVYLGEHVVQSGKVRIVFFIVKKLASVLAGTSGHTESLSKLGGVGVALLVELF